MRLEEKGKYYIPFVECLIFFDVCAYTNKGAAVMAPNYIYPYINNCSVGGKKNHYTLLLDFFASLDVRYRPGMSDTKAQR